MRVHDFEGWLAESLAAQPWAGTVARWSADGGPKPVGVTLAGKVNMQFVKAEPRCIAWWAGGTTIRTTSPPSPVIYYR
ncbi:MULTISPECIES: hypothetical protein [unclassified Micromonospora]|uniref:hypothetical protein n=1 Tax=unclassified Micromonospora TaxID=2617518 RepID=UPI00364443BD